MNANLPPGQFPPAGFPPPPAPPQHAAPKKPKKWGWILGIIGAFILGNAIGHAGDSATSATAAAPDPTYTAPAPTYSQPTFQVPDPATQAAPAQPTGPATTFSDGTYEVGPDIEPGRYKTPGSGGTSIWDSCYWERAKDDSGELGSIIANDNITGPGSITVKEGEFVKATGGCVWTKQ